MNHFSKIGTNDMNALMKRGCSVLLFWLAFTVAGNVYSQQCMQSFNVDQNKEVVHFGWLPGSDEFKVKPINCRALELSRQQLFVDQKDAINTSKLSSMQAYKGEVEKTMKELKNAQADLQKKLAQDSTINALIVTYRVLKYEFGKASTLIGCFAPEPTASKLFCAIGLTILVEDTVSVFDGSIAKTEISKRAKDLETKVGQLEKQYQELLKKEANFKMDLSQQHFTEMFNGMCQTVKNGCLR